MRFAGKIALARPKLPADRCSRTHRDTPAVKVWQQVVDGGVALLRPRRRWWQRALFYAFQSDRLGTVRFSTTSSIKIMREVVKARYHTLSARTQDMIEGIKTLVANVWNFIFDHNVSPLRDIPDVAVHPYSASSGACVGGQFLCRDGKAHVSCGQHTGSCGLECGRGGHGSHVYGRGKAPKAIHARSESPPRWRARLNGDCHLSSSLSLSQAGFNRTDAKTCVNHLDLKLREASIPGLLLPS